MPTLLIPARLGRDDRTDSSDSRCVRRL